MLATQSIEAQALQEGCRQACTIGLSINEDTKLKKGKEKGKRVVSWSCTNIQEGRQGASSKRANGSVAEYGRSFVQSFCHVTPGLLNSTITFCCSPLVL